MELNITNEQAIQARDAFLTDDIAGVTACTRHTIEEIRGNLLAGGGDVEVFDKTFGDVDVADLVGVYRAVARDASNQEWLDFVMNGELPDIVALSPTQMEGLKGGWYSVDSGGDAFVLFGGMASAAGFGFAVGGPMGAAVGAATWGASYFWSC